MCFIRLALLLAASVGEGEEVWLYLRLFLREAVLSLYDDVYLAVDGEERKGLLYAGSPVIGRLYAVVVVAEPAWAQRYVVALPGRKLAVAVRCEGIARIAEKYLLVVGYTVAGRAGVENLHVESGVLVEAVIGSVGTDDEDSVFGNVEDYFIVGEKIVDVLVLFLKKLGVRFGVVARYIDDSRQAQEENSG